MQTLERASDCIRSARSLDGAAAVLHELGFTDAALPLDRVALNSMGLPAAIRAARIAQGVGCLRGLAIELDDASDLRTTLASVARALSAIPQFLWIVCASRPDAGEIAIVCWSSVRSRVRMVSLICDSARVYESDAETLCALSAASGDSDLLTYSRWLDLLGREAITGRFFRTLKAVVSDLGESLNGRIADEERSELALLYISRLIFLSFLETKGWLNGDFGFLSNGFSRCVSEGGRYQKKVLEPLFFGTLNTAVRARAARARAFGRIPFLNGGLFSRSHLEKRRRASVFTDEAFGHAYGSLLSRYRFSGREDSADWSDAAIDPEILGKAFEALMAAPDRKTSGAYYTPQNLVEDLAGHALRSALSDAQASTDKLHLLTVLDPACGSGAFLVHMLERIAALRLEHGESGSTADVRRRVLMTSIFGVDLNPMAVWLCELRLWLSIVVESDEADPMRIVPLPNLDRHIRVGDSLAGGDFDDRNAVVSSRKVVSLRNRYMRAVGPRKRTLARTLDGLERSAAIDALIRSCTRLRDDRKEILIALRAKDLFGERHSPGADMRTRLAAIRSQLRELASRVKALRAGAGLPFSFAAHFSDAAATGGFDVVIGNPPWVRVHHIAESSRERLKRDFGVYRNAAWESGARLAGAGRGFGAQIDLAALFVERSHNLLRQGGTMALLLPSKLWRSLAGGGVRHLLVDRADVALVEDLTESRSQFDAAVYPSLLIARRRFERSEATRTPIAVTVHRAHGALRWSCSRDLLSVDDTTGSPWVLIPSAARKAFDRIARSGMPLSRSVFGRPLLGVKTGCNSAYIVHVESVDGDVAHISAGDRTGVIEREMLRSLIRGETLRKWSLTNRREYLIWPQCDDRPRRELPPLARQWLLPFRDTLSKRSDLHGRFPWWSVFRTESANNDRPRVVWADFGLTPNAIVVDAGEPFVALNSCYVVSCPTAVDAYALASLLNGPLAAAWLNVIAEPARGGYRRYLGWTTSLLPIPSDWNRARDLLAPLGKRATQGEVPTDEELLTAALDAYRLEDSDVQPLLAWGLGCD